MSMKKRYYCNWEGVACVYEPGEAWAFINNAWKRVESVEVATKAQDIGKMTFDQVFGQLPALPSTAFQSDGNCAAAAS